MNSAVEPKGLARASAERAAWEKDVAERQAVQARQAAHAAQAKINKLARREPIIADLVEEHSALRASLEALREKHATLETAHAELSRNVAQALEEASTLRQKADHAGAALANETARREKLEAALEETTSKLNRATAELARLKDAKGRNA